MLPDEENEWKRLKPHLNTFLDIYKDSFLICFVPNGLEIDRVNIFNPAVEVHNYENTEELLLRDYRFKLVFNFTRYKVAPHYKKLSALEVLDLPTLQALAAPLLRERNTSDRLSEVFRIVFCRPSLSQVI